MSAGEHIEFHGSTAPYWILDSKTLPVSLECLITGWDCTSIWTEVNREGVMLPGDLSPSSLYRVPASDEPEKDRRAEYLYSLDSISTTQVLRKVLDELENNGLVVFENSTDACPECKAYGAPNCKYQKPAQYRWVDDGTNLT